MAPAIVLGFLGGEMLPPLPLNAVRSVSCFGVRTGLGPGVTGSFRV